MSKPSTPDTSNSEPPHTQPPSDDMLHGWVDGALDAAQMEQVERWLADNPEPARRWYDYRLDAASLKAAFDPVMAEPVPDHLRPDTLRHLTPRRRQPPLWRMAAAAVVMLCIGGATGWSLRQATLPSGAMEPSITNGIAALPVDAEQAHHLFVSEVRHPVEVPVEDQAHLVAWLSKRLGHPVSAPPLAQIGFNLMGGRLLPSEAGPAAQFMYQNAEGRRLTLYIRLNPGNQETAFRFAEQNGTNGFYWTEGPLGYALFGEIDRAVLHDAALSVYDSLGYQ